MKTANIYLFMLCLVLSAGSACTQTQQTKSNAMNNQWIIDDLTTKWRSNKDYTLKVVEGMAAEHFDFKPTDAQKTFQEQIVHIAGNFKNLGKRVGIEGFQEIDETDKTSILASLGKNFDVIIAFLEEMKPEVLQEESKMWYGTSTKSRILNLMDNHLSHHRGQMIVYLRLKGVKPPGYVGW